MTSDIMLKRLVDSRIFKFMFPENDYVICMYVNDERIYNAD